VNHPDIFYGPEDYDLFITQSVAKAAERVTGLGMFSFKSTPGDITDTLPGDTWIDAAGFRQCIEGDRAAIGSPAWTTWYSGDESDEGASTGPSSDGFVRFSTNQEAVSASFRIAFIVPN